MSIDYPTDLDVLVNPASTDSVNTVSHSSQHANANDAIEALEAKVGVDGSAVTTSHDYKLSTVTSTDKAASQDGTQTLTNKTLTSPVINTPAITGGNFTSGTMVNGIINGTTAISLGSDATGDIYYRDASGNIQRVAIGSNNQLLTSNGTIPSWDDAPASALNCTSGVSVGPATTGTSVMSIAHGLSRTPVVIRLHGIGQQVSGEGSPQSHGSYTDSGNSCVYMPQTSEATTPLTSGTVAVVLYGSNAQGLARGSVQNVTSGTFEILWDGPSGGSIAGTTVFHWECQ
jgi:hypothetical protein